MEERFNSELQMESGLKQMVLSMKTSIEMINGHLNHYFVAAVGMNMIDLISGEIVFLENKVPDQNTTYLHLNTGYSI